jgi:photosystem II stability/assembly factor-like uncharacterized protein
MRATTRARGVVVGFLVAGAAASLAGCSSGQDATVQAGGPAAPDDEASVAGGQRRITDARLVAGGLGWATSPEGLFVTTDAGAAWQRWALPVPAQSLLDVALLAPRRALVASNDGAVVRVLSTGDAGATWEPVELGSVPGGPAAGQFAQDRDRVAGLLVERASSSNFSLADWYATADGGLTWTRRDAPVSGVVSLTGDGLWVAGGPARNQLFHSGDGGASWAEVTLPASLPSGSIALEPPAARPDGRTILPVTVAGDGKASVVFLSTDDKGRSWKEAARADVPADVGRGVALPTSPGATADTLLVAAPDGSQVVRVPLDGGAVLRITPQGLAKGVAGVRLTDEQLGWATFTTSSCRADKTACTSTTGLLATRDGGQTWRVVTPASGG